MSPEEYDEREAELERDALAALSDEDIRNIAWEEYATDSDGYYQIDIDDEPEISRADGHAWVQAWVLVRPEVEVTDDEQ